MDSSWRIHVNYSRVHQSYPHSVCWILGASKRLVGNNQKILIWDFVDFWMILFSTKETANLDDLKEQGSVICVWRDISGSLRNGKMMLVAFPTKSPPRNPKIILPTSWPRWVTLFDLVRQDHLTLYIPFNIYIIFEQYSDRWFQVTYFSNLISTSTAASALYLVNDESFKIRKW